MTSPMSLSLETRTTSYIFTSAMFSATISGPETFVIVPCIYRIPSFFIKQRCGLQGLFQEDVRADGLLHVFVELGHANAQGSLGAGGWG